MKSRALWVAACAAAFGSLACPLGAADSVSVSTHSGCGGELSASATVTAQSVDVRVAHRQPFAARGPGAHLHVCVRGDGSHADTARGIPPRSPKAHMRQPADHVSLTVPVASGTSVREIRVSCVHGPHAACHASGAHQS